MSLPKYFETQKIHNKEVKFDKTILINVEISAQTFIHCAILFIDISDTIKVTG